MRRDEFFAFIFPTDWKGKEGRGRSENSHRKKWGEGTGCCAIQQCLARSLPRTTERGQTSYSISIFTRRRMWEKTCPPVKIKFTASTERFSLFLISPPSLSYIRTGAELIFEPETVSYFIRLFSSCSDLASSPEEGGGPERS